MNGGLIQALKLRLSPGLFAAYKATLRVETLQPDPRNPSPRIFACLHRDILPAILHVAAARPTLLISHSLDGDILRRTLGEEAYGFVRGSTGSQGGEAFRRLLGSLRQGQDLGLAVDGPRGPFGKIHDGVLMLSRLSGAPIVPLRARGGAHLTLRNWDHTLLPLPFSRVAVEALAPIQVPRDCDAGQLTRYAERLRSSLLAPGEAT